jgi:uncharacterized peroxidase-related enzyme
MTERAWIGMVEPADASGTLHELYERVKTPHGTIDNVMKVHSLRPHTMAGHLALYKSVLHDPGNTMPLWFLETVAAYVSMTNNCAYSLAHHWRNAAALIGDAKRAASILGALEADRPGDAFSGKELALLHYARKLTAEVGAMARADIESLRAAGADDGEILEVNQVCAYFNYSNRLLNGLGVTTEGDSIGYYNESTA